VRTLAAAIVVGAALIGGAIFLQGDDSSPEEPAPAVVEDTVPTSAEVTSAFKQELLVAENLLCVEESRGEFACGGTDTSTDFWIDVNSYFNVTCDAVGCFWEKADQEGRYSGGRFFFTLP
jgi:hypothetical protein